MLARLGGTTVHRSGNRLGCVMGTLALVLAGCGESGGKPEAKGTVVPAAGRATGFPVRIENCGRTLTFDEPPSRVVADYQPGLEILSLVRSLGVTTVAALHDLNLASTYCDRLFVMPDGCIVASGPPHEVLTPTLAADVFAVRLRRWTDPDSGRTHLAFEPLEPGNTPDRPECPAVGRSRT